MEIAFDAKLFAAVRVTVPDGMERKAAIALARRAVRAEVDGLDINRTVEGKDDDGTPVKVVVTEASLDGELPIFEIDGKDFDEEDDE